MSIFWLVIATRIVIPFAFAGLVTIFLRRPLKGFGYTRLVIALGTAATASLLTKLTIIWLRS